MRPDLPCPVGAEGVGGVATVGSPEDRPLIGSRVMILPNYEQGTWADRVLVASRNVVVVDGEADPLQLAMTSINPATAAVLLRRFATLRPGDWVGQTAANSAVGSTSRRSPSARGCGHSISSGANPRFKSCSTRVATR